MNRLLFLLPVLFIACGTQVKTANGTLQQEPATKEAATTQNAKNEPAENLTAEKPPLEDTALIAVETWKLGDLTQESYEEILDDVKDFVENLNLIIKGKNYNKWRSVLSEERLNEISSAEFLADVSKTNSMKRRGIVLKTVYDYFLYVVVPSRANSQVDKIDILDNNRVRAFYMYTRKTGEKNETETIPLLVYELAKTGDSWIIIR